jgi:hypothetical protein
MMMSDPESLRLAITRPVLANPAAHATRPIHLNKQKAIPTGGIPSAEFKTLDRRGENPPEPAIADFRDGAN